MAKERIIMDKEAISSALKKISKAILDKNGDTKSIVLVGVMNRGVPLAQRIAKNIASSTGINVPVGSLDVSLHRDDIMKKGSKIEVKRSDMPFSMDGKVVILIDDVISAGRTIRAALDGITAYGRASKIELGVLIDRDTRELPIHPDFTGLKVQTTKDEDVQVSVLEIDGVDKVTIK